MISLPTLVQDLALTKLTNSVYVGTIKFTIEQISAVVDEFPEGTPALDAVRPQLADAKTAYRVLDEAYVLTLRSAITDDIAALDSEGDQLLLAVKETTAAFMRMTFDQEKSAKASAYNEFLKKYHIDIRENMISEWSKVQQLCEEFAATEALQQAATALGLTATMQRLTAISDLIRQKITQRSGELPEAQQMKKARAAMDPEYKTLILILNAAQVIYAREHVYDALIKTLNGNINYVKVHAMTKSTTSGGDTPAPEPEPEPSPEPEPEPEPEPSPEPEPEQ